MTVWDCESCNADLRFGAPGESMRAECRKRKDLRNIEEFWQAVCTRAEAKMLTAGKLEGAHYTAATEIIAEMRRVAE